jgi:hypothetical protein
MSYEKQLAEAEALEARWWGAFREVVTEIGAKLVYETPASVHVDLPEGWTMEAFEAEVQRRAEKNR